MVQSNTDAALEFLRRWEPHGPWLLVGIVPDGKATAQCFFPTDEAQCRAWIDARQGKENLYFHVNRVTNAINKKAEKTDIGLVRWLHIDIDPAPNKPFEEERAAALQKLREFSPAPTVIIDSGGGFQGFWKLKDPVRVDGDEARANEAEAYNIQLEIVFGADRCHNVDRIMRLPGTVNIPNQKKRAKGREARVAELVEFNEFEYPLAVFTPAPRVQGEGGSGGGTAARNRVKISGNLRRLNSVDELPAAVNDRTKMLIVQGHDPDDPTKYKSRSECLFAVVCALVRADLDDDTIASVILDPDFGISASVLDKPRPEAYAAKQIARAKDEAIAPELRELNDLHAVIETDMGGRCRVISEMFDATLGRSRIVRQSFEDFSNRYRNRRVIVGQSQGGAPIEKPLGKWWLDHPLRRQYQCIQFVPGQEIDGRYYNLWKGFASDAKPGTKHESFLQHVYENLCDRDEGVYRYLVGWMARAVQKPDRPGEVAVVLRGKRGTGKSFFARVFGSLWGQHFLAISDPKHLVGSFNAHLRDCVVLFADEAFYAGDKKHESILKTLITEDTLMIEGKGVDAENAPNYTHLIMASNDEWVVPAGYDERRYLVLDVSDRHAQDHAYFAAIRAELDDGGRAALLHFLLTHDISGYDVRKVPQTKGLRDQKQLSRRPEESWWFNKLHDGRILNHHNRWECEVNKDMLFQDYVNEMQRMGIQRRLSREALGKFLSRVCPEEGWPRNNQRVTDYSEMGPQGEEVQRRGRKWFLNFPPLADLRGHFDRYFGGPYDWPAEITDDVGEPQVPF